MAMMVYLFSRIIFDENVSKINRHNLEADFGLHTYTLKINKFADMVIQFQVSLSMLVPKTESSRTTSYFHRILTPTADSFNPSEIEHVFIFPSRPTKNFSKRWLGDSEKTWRRTYRTHLIGTRISHHRMWPYQLR